MFAARRPSFNALIQLRASKAIARWLGVARMPSSLSDIDAWAIQHQYAAGQRALSSTGCGAGRRVGA
jgi:hypothetical protein